MICGSPSYIYSSTLPLSPSSSWLHQCYSAEFPQEIKVIRRVSAGWGKCFRTVLLDDHPWALTCLKDTVVVGLGSGSIIILNSITGIQMAIFSGHTGYVASLVFSLDGRSLVSDSGDNTIKLWDMQTGGVIKTFQSHTDWVVSVSISADCTTIASGSLDGTICLWDVQTGECCHVIKQKSPVKYVCFFPLNPEHLISVSGGKIWQWDTSGQQIAPEHDGSHVAFSLDGIQFVVCNGSAVEVQVSDSKGIVAKFHAVNNNIGCCCFSPDNSAIAVATGSTVHIWDISNSDPYLLETFIGHIDLITSLALSSPTSFISASKDKSVKFWQIGISSTDSVLPDLGSIPLASAPIKSITLQTRDSIAISSHSDGVVRIWDILTGLCKASFQTPSKDSHQVDTQLTDGRLISVWYRDEKLCIWDTEKGELLRMVDIPGGNVRDLRISGDGSMVFCLYWESIQAWSIWTGEVLGKVEYIFGISTDSFSTVDGLRVWVNLLQSSALIIGWDFGVLGLSPNKLSNMSQNRPHLDFIGGMRKQRSFLPGIQDTTTRKVVIQLPERLVRPLDAQWDGQYLVAGYDSGEVLILEYNHVLH